MELRYHRAARRPDGDVGADPRDTKQRGRERGESQSGGLDSMRIGRYEKKEVGPLICILSRHIETKQRGAFGKYLSIPPTFRTLPTVHRLCR